MKKALVILNPRAGMRKGAQNLYDILAALQQGGYLCTLAITTKAGDGTDFVTEQAQDKDLVVCIGGDGTYNEVAAGMLQAGYTMPLGYIPAGSTNDFANSMNLSSNIKTAALDIVTGRETLLDMGSFGGRPFAYVASFGAFTKTSYSTPQTLKNMLGHLAYILEGLKDLTTLQPVHMRIETDVQAFEDNYLFGAFSNSTSIGGLLRLKKDYVDMGDGLLEVLLIRSPRNAMELGRMLVALKTGEYGGSECITFCSTRRAFIQTEKGMDWSLDGERAEGAETLEIVNLPGVLRLMVPEK
ncbi:MAG: diacylglycerol kinase family lipid kinase [Clostridiales bacterium]|nr:diacylglycerol kinase family lipid kinase [Clostridiales bacterium]